MKFPIVISSWTELIGLQTAIAEDLSKDEFNVDNVEAMRITGKSESTLKRYRDSNQLDYKQDKEGGKVYYRRRDLLIIKKFK